MRTAADTWTDTGVVRLHGLIGEERLAGLETESLSRIGGETTLYERTGVTMQRDGSLACPAHCRMTDGGPVMQSILRDKTILARLREATGCPRLFPTGGALVIYANGDFQGLHTDASKATVTVIIGITPGLPPMRYAPSWRFDPASTQPHAIQLKEAVARHGIFPDGPEFAELPHPYRDDVVQGFAGYDLPHWRPPHRGEQPGMIATFGYMDL